MHRAVAAAAVPPPRLSRQGQARQACDL